MKISIIIPVYNSERYIQRTLDSIADQVDLPEDTEIEIIIADDYSTDDTLKICKQFKKFPMMIFTHFTNSGGPNWGRNMGIKHATGDLLCFLDSDDAWMPDKLSKQLKEIKNGYEFVYSSGTHRQE